MPVSPHILVVNVKKDEEGWLEGLPNEWFGPHPDPSVHSNHATLFDALSSLRLYLQVRAAATLPLRVLIHLRMPMFVCFVCCLQEPQQEDGLDSPNYVPRGLTAGTAIVAKLCRGGTFKSDLLSGKSWCFCTALKEPIFDQYLFGYMRLFKSDEAGGMRTP